MTTLIILLMLLGANTKDTINPVEDSWGGGVVEADIDLNGYDLICDADGDTKLDIGDNTINVNINGAKDFSFTANTLQCETGSTLKTNTIAPTGTDISVTIGAGTVGVGDGTYVWGHTPMLGIEGIVEFLLATYTHGIAYFEAALNLANNETIANSTNGQIVFTGVGQTNNENLILDLETNANTATVSTTTGVDTLKLTNMSIDLSTGYYVIDPSSIHRKQRTTDAIAATMKITAGDAYEIATGATNPIGGSLTLCPGVGSRSLSFTGFATADSDVITVTCNGTATTLTSEAHVGDLGAGEYLCITDAPTCALAFKTYFNTVSALTTNCGATAVCSTEPCTDGKVHFQFNPTLTCTYTHTVTDTGGGGAVAVATSGADGQTLFARGSAAKPTIGTIGTTGTGIYFETNAIGFSTGGSVRFYASATEVVLASVLNASGSRIYDSTRSTNIGTAYTPAANATGDVALGGNTSISTLAIATLTQADLDNTCAIGQLKLDTGGATKELCYCQAADTWYCAAIADTTGPAD